MNDIIMLQNSNVSFGVNAEKIYQPQKYNLHLIVNQFCFNILKSKNQEKYFKNIVVTDHFEFENILSLITNFIQGRDKFDVITNSEETIPICGKMRLHLGIDSEDYSRFYDKHIMKVKLVNKSFINIPRYHIFDSTKYLANPEMYLKSLIDDMSFPLFTKPVQLYSSINLKKIHNINELSSWAKTVDGNELYEIDEFIEGTMYHCDSYIKNRKVLFTFVSQNSRPCYDFTVGKIKGTIVLPTSHPDSILFMDIAARTLHALGIPKAGVTHLEIIKTKDNQIYFIEIAHRSPGCLIPRMYKEHAGIDTITSHLLLQIDSDYYPIPKPSKYAAWACYPKIPGRVYDLMQPPSLKSNWDIEWNVRVGDLIKTYSQFGRDYTGAIFLTNKNFDTLFNEFDIINDINLCQINPLDYFQHQICMRKNRQD